MTAHEVLVLAAQEQGELRMGDKSLDSPLCKAASQVQIRLFGESRGEWLAYEIGSLSEEQ